MIKSTDKARSWFCVWNNPQKYLSETDPREMVIKATEMFYDNKPSRSCAINYEIGKEGTPHMHMVLESSSQIRFSTIQKIFPGIHIAPTLGTKEEAEDYIHKRGKHEEKHETLIVEPIYIGEISGAQGRRTDLETIYDMLEQGFTPKEIMKSDIAFRRFEHMIKSHFFDMKKDSIPNIRDVNVIWHIGDTGTGKSYTYDKLIKIHGIDNIYFCNVYEFGGFDNYCAEPILFMDEFKGDIKYQTLLTLLDKYTAQIRCRYANNYMLWNEVHITSVYTPREIYEMTVDSKHRMTDSYEQLARRINTLVYHYVTADGDFKEYTIPFADFSSLDILKELLRE